MTFKHFEFLPPFNNLLERNNFDALYLKLLNDASVASACSCVKTCRRVRNSMKIATIPDFHLPGSLCCSSARLIFGTVIVQSCVHVGIVLWKGCMNSVNFSWISWFLHNCLSDIANNIIGRLLYTSSTTYTDRSCADVISRCVVLFPASFYPSFSNVQYVWKPVYTYGDNV